MEKKTKYPHPFEPIIFNNTTKLLIGTLPPEKAPFYFSNSVNTRLWDILQTVSSENETIYQNSNNLSDQQKEEILKSLDLGIYDIIKEYDRKNMESTKDSDIIPLKYSDIIKLVSNTEINTLLFVYQNAALWFLHSLKGGAPEKIEKLKSKLEYGVFHKLKVGSKEISCILLPSPLNRGKKGETLEYKLERYKYYIKN